jgi:hypothetical protein
MKFHHSTRRKIKLYAVIIAICIVIAVALNLMLEEKRNQISDMGPDAEMMGKARDILGEHLDDETMAKLKKAYEGKLSEAELERLKKHIEERLDPSQVERFRETYKTMGGGQRQHP